MNITRTYLASTHWLSQFPIQLRNTELPFNFGITPSLCSFTLRTFVFQETGGDRIAHNHSFPLPTSHTTFVGHNSSGVNTDTTSRGAESGQHSPCAVFAPSQQATLSKGHRRPDGLSITEHVCVQRSRQTSLSRVTSVSEEPSEALTILSETLHSATACQHRMAVLPDIKSLPPLFDSLNMLLIFFWH
jgi:hypothetical protein